MISSRSEKSRPERARLQLAVAHVESLEQQLERLSRPPAASCSAGLSDGSCAPRRPSSVSHSVAARGPARRRSGRRGSLIPCDRRRSCASSAMPAKRSGRYAAAASVTASPPSEISASSASRGGLLEQARRLGRVEDAKAGVEAGRHRVRAEQPAAKAVDRRHPGALGLARQALQLARPRAVAGPLGRPGAAAELEPDPPAQLGCGPLGEGEGEDLVDRDPVLGQRVAVAADEHPRLARAGAGLAEDVGAAGVDRRLSASAGRRRRMRSRSASGGGAASSRAAVSTASGSASAGAAAPPRSRLSCASSALIPIPSPRPRLRPRARAGRSLGRRTSAGTCRRSDRGRSAGRACPALLRRQRRRGLQLVLEGLGVELVGADQRRSRSGRDRRGPCRGGGGRARPSRRAAGTGRRPGRDRSAAASPACRAGSAACPRRAPALRRRPCSRSCSRAAAAERPSGETSMRSILPRRAICAEVERIRLARRRLDPRRLLALVESEPNLEQVPPRAHLGLRFRLGDEEGLDLLAHPRQRDPPRGIAGRRAGGFDLLVEQLGEALAPAPHVAGTRDRVAARRVQVETMQGGVYDRAEPQRIGHGLEALRAQLVLDEPAVGAFDPPLERVGAEQLALSQRAARPPGFAAGPGRSSGSRDRAQAAATSSRAGPAMSSAATASAASLPPCPRTASARASALAVDASAWVGHDVGQPGRRASSPSSELLGAVADQVEHLVDEGRAGEGTPVVVGLAPAQVEALGRPGDADVEQVALVVALVAAAQGGDAEARSRLLAEQRVGRSRDPERRPPASRRRTR